MFGYVTPLKAELKIKDYTKFRSYYCGLCLELKKSLGMIPRLTLNYDMAFLAVLIDSISPEEPSLEIIKGCIAHPIEKKPVMVNNKSISYAAAMNLTLYYYKLKDDVQDDNNFKSKFFKGILKPYQKKLGSSQENITKIIEKNLNTLTNYENNKNFSYLDEIAHPFSDIVGNILKEYPNKFIDDCEELRNNLYNLGYTLGKWIYLIDALDDLEEDIKSSKFNPINYLFNKDNKPYEELLPLIKDRMEFTILNCSYNCNSLISNLPIKRNMDILKNVLELGLMDKYLLVLKNNNKKKGGDSNESI